MGDALEGRKLLTSARAGLLHGSDRDLPDVPAHVAASWRRSVAYGIDPSMIATSYHPDVEVESRLARYARPAIEQLAEHTADIPACIVLTDEQARLLIRLDTTPAIGRVADGNYFAEKFSYAERAVGTNGVGTVLESGTSVQIVGAEHFVEQLHPYACAGAPVQDPFTGRIAGVIDVSCWAEHSSPMLHSLVRSAARRVQHDLLRDRDPAQQALLDAYSRLEARTRQAVLAVGQRTVLANGAMHTLLNPADLAVLQDHARFAMSRYSAIDDRVTLPSGGRVRLRGTTISIGGTVAGLVGEVTMMRETGEMPAPSGIPAPRAAIHDVRPVPQSDSRTPAYQAAWTTVGEALRAETALLVLGESGSGRGQLVTELDAALHGPGHVVDLGPETRDPDLATRIRRAGPSELVLLRNIDQHRDGDPDELLNIVERCATRVAATAAEITPRGSVQGELLSRFRRSATVPPLRDRRGDLSELVVSLLTELVPDRESRISPEALRTLSRYEWPGNLRELRDVLEAALRRRPVGTIEADDLPGSCQSTPRSSLRPIEQAERDAIIDALHNSGGNRAAAAVALGIARSTLYRKIAHYQITN